MALVDEVLSFAREFINKPSARTKQRKAQISEVLHQMTGRHLGQSCNTCYIEALYTILNLTNMSAYRMKKGYVAQFNVPYKGIKSFTNKQITDDLAKEYLRRYPERIIYFEVVPKPAGKPVVPASIKIIKPVKKEPEVIAESKVEEVEEKQEIETDDDLATSKPEKLIAETIGEVQQKPRPKPRPKKKTTSKKSD